LRELIVVARLTFAFYSPTFLLVPIGFSDPEQTPSPDKKRARNAVVLAASIIAAPHLDGKGDTPRNRAIIAEPSGSSTELAKTRIAKRVVAEVSRCARMRRAEPL
jgi:hypothetical protein